MRSNISPAVFFRRLTINTMIPETNAIGYTVQISFPYPIWLLVHHYKTFDVNIFKLKVTNMPYKRTIVYQNYVSCGATLCLSEARLTEARAHALVPRAGLRGGTGGTCPGPLFLQGAPATEK